MSDCLDGLWQGLLTGNTAIRPVNRFPVKNYNAGIAGCIEGLNPSGSRSRLHSLCDRLFNNWAAPVPSDTLLITATTKAGIDNLEKVSTGKAADIQDILPSSIPAIVSKKLGLDSRGFNVSAACASSTIAVAQAAALISTGCADVVLVCCLDMVTEFIFSGFSALRALSPLPCRPFDRDRNGLSLGEGAAALLLMSRERAKKEHRIPMGAIHGWGIANDATHITAPARDGCGLIWAISRALQVSGIPANELHAVCAHGTGTIYNDLMELTAFKQIFKNGKASVFSIKGAIGHTLGAAGGIEVAVGMKTLSCQVTPPTIGLKTPMDEAMGWVSTGPVSFSGDYLLTTNSGFGGINAALVLGKP
ncbi:MAG: beta-ketoacyl synthase N-terminal-like domain-containing protein [Deltaproteobacteria bacterium]|nr:beta-ketoacyl synthase N-terminal-like domain-containing protein [Deltaproteobacteria bacterium]